MKMTISIGNIAYRFRVSLATKIVGLVTGTVFIVSMSIFGMIYYLLFTSFNEQAKQELLLDANLVQSDIEFTQKMLAKTGDLMAGNQTFAYAVKERNAAFLKQYIKNVTTSTSDMFVTIADRKGDVIVRSHSEKAGDNVTNQKNVKKALAGESTIGIESGTEIKYALRAGHPVTIGNEIVGTVTTGMDLSTSHNFVDSIKKKLGIECTLFQWDTRASTTILKDGQRATGTKMDNPEVIETVLKKGEKFHKVNNILGKDYDTLYWPILLADGKIGGMFFVGKDREKISKAYMSIVWSILLSTLIVGSIMVVTVLYFTRSIMKPLGDGLEFAKRMSEGDLTQAMAVNREDEIGRLGNALNHMTENLRQMVKDVSHGVETLSFSSTELSSVSQKMSDGVEQTAGKANLVSAASNQMNMMMTSVAAAMEQAAKNVTMVATATEEMTSTISEIARNSEKARTITEGAVVQAEAASTRVDELGRAAQEIGKVTETITEISGQTNLLALNATIEAARAGEAGKGFAVVANEIKELAKQTATATEEIKRKIEGIQGSTENTVKEIGEVSKVIHDVNEIVSTIAAAVVEQATTTKEISSNVSQMSTGIDETGQSITQSSSLSEQIAKDISEVSQAAGEMKMSSGKVIHSTKELFSLSEKLSEMVGRFKI
jgi:methyl-accepting chemotaxis protein